MFYDFPFSSVSVSFVLFEDTGENYVISVLVILINWLLVLISYYCSLQGRIKTGKILGKKENRL